jgi:hypothetical protein
MTRFEGARETVNGSGWNDQAAARLAPELGDDRFDLSPVANGGCRGYFAFSYG